MYAHGTKNSYRARYVEVTEDWGWEIVAKHVKTLAPNALLFPDLTERGALDVHNAAAETLGLRRSRRDSESQSPALPLTLPVFKSFRDGSG